MSNKAYNPAFHYNHCAMCGSPITTEKERNMYIDKDGSPYHHGCAQEMGDLEQIDEEYNEQHINIT